MGLKNLLKFTFNRKMFNKNLTETKCVFYNWGGDLDKGYALYPREYGARCEYYKEFFLIDKLGMLIPYCYSCQNKKMPKKLIK